MSWQPDDLPTPNEMRIAELEYEVDEVKAELATAHAFIEKLQSIEHWHKADEVFPENGERILMAGPFVGGPNPDGHKWAFRIGHYFAGRYNGQIRTVTHWRRIDPPDEAMGL